MNNPPLDLFLEACGAPGPIRVGVGPKDGMQTEGRSFGQPFLVIGRGPGTDLTLEHWQVSRRHAYLQLLGGRYFCLDLGSRTGTHGGDATERMGWLDEGHAIRIGPYAVRPEAFPATAEEPRRAPGVTWELPGRAIGQSLWRMDQDLILVGRSPACRIRIVENDVSKFHCSLVATRLGVWVVDLLGRDGVLVNGEPVRCARLEDGDELRVGRHAIRPRYDAPPPPLGPPEILEDPAPSGGSLARLVGGDAIPAWPTAGGGIPAFVGPAGTGLDPTVSVLVHQFGMMQQQMFDQFHRTMMMMFEGFATLHRETSGSLREEFEQVRKLSGEIEALRAETARLAAAASRAPERLRPPPTNGHGPAPPRGPPPDPAEAVRKATPPPPDPHVDIHAQLLMRLSTIQAERQNRWQKILGMMSSKP